MLTRDEVVALLTELGQPMGVGTWSAMVSRGQAPRPDQMAGRTPLWAPSTVTAWARSRPGRGARTDVVVHGYFIDKARP